MPTEFGSIKTGEGMNFNSLGIAVAKIAGAKKINNDSWSEEDCWSEEE